MLQVFVCVVFSYFNEIKKAKNYKCDGLGNQIPYKMMFVSATQVKNCGRKCILSGQSAIFQGEGKTHRNITILTMWKISTRTRITLLICNVCIITLMK